MAVIGTGDFGRSFVFQSTGTPGLEVVAVCDTDGDAATNALARAGIASDRVVTATTSSDAKAAAQAGKLVSTCDVALLADVDVDVVVEATGNAEAAARHAREAIAAGRHVVMVSKEADSVVGALLAAEASAAGVVYTPVDGDQPALLIQKVLWAKICGMELICAAKASEYDFVWDEAAGTVSCLDRTVSVPDFGSLWQMTTPSEIVAARSTMLAGLPQHTVADQTEMAIVANALELEVDTPAFHAPIARVTEIADILTTKARGGILDHSGVVDVVNLLRRPDEFSLAGGVFVVVACDDERTWEMLARKGHLVSRDRRSAVIPEPVHLLGVQSATTVLLAAVERRSSGSGTQTAKFDVVARANKPIPAGTVLTPNGAHHSIDGLDGRLVPAGPVRGDAPVPFHMASGCTLAANLSAGEDLTLAHLHAPQASTLWAMRREMDARFWGD
ncbi:flagellar biosynthesis protein FlgA [Acuticoccus sp. I52.16.1]|uniref:flagellar biosynthesis protein FlgA n=1 Tax=Acuticoccus sp. I52.16.1 TaxID=2928472 RepID=UPI001FD2E2B4|nr:flagellar biosynthesis protein FlgA [Acuticoccus sp. I52.16.1]UOM33778.1 flagellar biosynthesis protein FlgA [Acuticoccus sp. I52.16.1]